MKTNCWMILGTMLAMTAVAQVNTNNLPAIPAPANTAPGTPAPLMTPAESTVTAPAKKPAKAPAKKAAKKSKPVAKPVVKKAPEPLVMLVAGPAMVAAEHVNLRGQAGLKGEVVGHLEKGDMVTVISQINLDKPKAGEPAQWAKISLPLAVKVWIHSKFIDASNSTVSVKKLNLRGGPGENYSVLGVLEKGAPLSVVATKGDWTQIEAPASAFAFMAASYLKQDSSITVPSATPAVATEAVPPPSMPPTPTTLAEAQPIAPPATTPPPVEMTPPPTPTPVPEVASTPPPVTPVMLPEPTLVEDDTNLPPPPPRIVTHEGSVRHSVSLVAPTDFELYDQINNKAINYLFSTTTNLNLGRYNGLHITVTGEEGMDPRWKDTPVLTIQKIYVLSGTPKEVKEEKQPAETPAEKPVAKKKHWWSK